MDIINRFHADDENRMRRYGIGNKLISEWFTQCVPILALEYGIPEEVVKQDLASDEFRDALIRGFRLHVHRGVITLGGEFLTEQFLSNIRQSAVSRDISNYALNLTLQAIIEYISAMRESVLVNLRFNLESMLVSRNNALLNRTCELCGAPMKIVDPSGGGSYFASCSRYPACNNPKQLTAEDIESAPRAIDSWMESDLDRAIARLMYTEINWKPSSYDEAATRTDFIDPILRSLGWDTYSNTNVQSEQVTPAGRADYSLKSDNGKLFAVVEAKKLYANLSLHQDQLHDYMTAAGVKIGILTNGFGWEIYEAVSYDQIALIFAVDDILCETSDNAAWKLIELIGNKSASMGFSFE